MVGTGSAGDFSMLARCSIVNHHGNVLYNSYVAPLDKITDYRTRNYSTTLKRRYVVHTYVLLACSIIL